MAVGKESPKVTWETLRHPLVERFVALLLLRRLTLRVVDKLLRGCRCDECKTNGDCCGMTVIGEKTARPLLAANCRIRQSP
jgi:hypothetical protein